MIPPLTAVAQPATVRLISTAYFKPPVLKVLVDTDEELQILEDLEGLTNRRLRAERSGLASLHPRELIFQAWGRTYINAAFTYTRAEGNRFNSGDRGAWYCAFDEGTAIAEVGFHRTRELANIGRFEDEAIYQALLAGFIGDFHDLRKMKPRPDCLGPDPASAYPAGQQLARELRHEGSRGLVYPSVRRRGGTCLVAFEPHVVQNVRPAARWKLSWTGSAGYTVTTV